MHPKLLQIDEVFRSIEKDYYYEDVKRNYANMTEDELAAYAKKINHANEVYTAWIQKFPDAVTGLDHAEIEEAYREGSRILRSALTGHMSMHFNEAYIPVMKWAIIEDHHFAYRFLDILHRHLPMEEVKPFFLVMLESKNIINLETALRGVQEFRLTEAIPKVRELAQNIGLTIAEDAQQVLDSFNEN